MVYQAWQAAQGHQLSLFNQFPVDRGEAVTVAVMVERAALAALGAHPVLAAKGAPRGLAAQGATAVLQAMAVLASH